jgi:hypothetical protein
MVITIPVTSAHADPGHQPSPASGPSLSSSRGTPSLHGNGHSDDHGRGGAFGHGRGNPHHSYPGTVPTHTSVAASPARVGRSETIRVNVAPFGFAKATGSVTVTVTGPHYSDSATVDVHGGWASVTVKPLTSAGLYFVKATFTPSDGSVFSPSSGGSGFFAANMPWWWGWPWF